MEQYQQPKEQVLTKLHASAGGLTSEDAAFRLQKQGRNKLDAQKKHSLIGLFFSQFKDLMSLILIAAAFLSGALAFATGDKNELADTAILLFIILLNAVVGFLQQYRADTAIEKLKELSKAKAKAVRDNQLVVVDAEELVPGDVVEIEEGDRVPADCRALSLENFKADESALTGESKPVKKRDCTVIKTVLAARENTVHLSTYCVGGSGRFLVVKTGMDTEVGKIAGMISGAKPTPSPLDKTLSRLGKIITISVLTVAAILFAGGLLARRVTFLENLMAAVAVAVAAIPEGMGAVVTIILAMGVQRMAKAKAVIRKLSSVETLGACTCICSDKTGTLTKNKMTVEEIKTDFSREGKEVYCASEAQKRLLTCMRLCHTVKGSAGAYVGDPTEIALVEYADALSFVAEGEKVGGIPFSSERKRMSVAVRVGGKTRLYVKGGADVLLKKCTKRFTAAGELPLTKEEREKIDQEISRLSGQAMRLIAFAEGDYNGSPEEEGLTFLGIAAMLDPPKEGAKEAVAACKKAGVKVVMITGDSAETAFAIACRLGIASSRGEVITGEELDNMGEERYFKEVKRYSVYARVSPKHKQEIVKALQRKGEVVAMTGDGVNDAPALKAADIGVAMGSGTDVTKGAADMVLTNDDFSAMVHAVEEGRNVFMSVKKTICFFLATNLAEVLSVLFATLFLWKYEFLTSTQLLWINLITDSLPVLALGAERSENVMEMPPAKGVFTRRSVLEFILFGVIQTCFVLFLFGFGVHRWGNAAASTSAFLLLSLLELFHAFNVRKEKEPLGLKGLVSNRTLLVTVAIGIAVNAALVLIPPLRAAFSLTALTPIQWGVTLLLAVAIVPVGELYKTILRAALRLRARRKSASKARHGWGKGGYKAQNERKIQNAQKV